MRQFSIKLEQALTDEPLTAQEQGDQLDTVNKAKQNIKQPVNDTTGQQQVQKPNPQDAAKQQQDEKNKAQSQNLAQQMVKMDDNTNKVQAKISGGSAKPTDINQLNQVLTAKQTLQKQLLKLNGLPTS